MLELSDAQFDAMMQVNVNSVTYDMQAIVPDFEDVDAFERSMRPWLARDVKTTSMLRGAAQNFRWARIDALRSHQFHRVVIDTLSHASCLVTMPILLAQFHGELDTGWAEELRPVEHAAILLLADIADEVKANGEDGLRFDYTSSSGRRYRMQLRIDEAARRAMLSVFPQLPLGFPAGCAPALASRLNARLGSAAFDQSSDGSGLAFHSMAEIEQDTESDSIRRLVDATTLPLELFEVAARRMVRPCRGQRAR